MNNRIKKLREQSTTTQPVISLERAELLTEFYSKPESRYLPIPIARASALKYIFSKKTLCVNDGELIVGERGPAPHSTPTYPEICTHSIKDFEILDTREKISFKVGAEEKVIQEQKITPFWKNQSLRDRLFEEVDDEWKDSYEAGVFTEFMEQRAPGHTVLDDKIYKKGFKDFKHDIEIAINNLDFLNDPEALEKRDELKAMKISLDAVLVYAKRNSEKLQKLADSEKDSERKIELETMAGICERVPENAPQTFWEALQYYWFVHIGVITELNTWDSFNPGRLDQHLYPFYKRDIESGLITEEKAKELLMSFWVKFNNQPAPPKVGVTAQESNTYTDFCLINVGGLNEKGENAVNSLSYLILDVIEEMRLLQPSSMVQISKKNPDNFLRRVLHITKTGYGQPSIFNTDSIIQEMLRHGKSIIDARNGGASGCVETGAFGKESYILTGYFNMPKVFEITMHNGIDPRTGKEIGLKTGDFNSFKSFDEIWPAFEKQMEHFVNIKMRGNRIIERLWAKILPAPFMSVLVDDCISKGKDYNAGGARYNSSYIQGVGMGSLTDSLSAIKYHVFEKRNLELQNLSDAMNSNFEGYDEIRKLLLHETPKYGNDDDRADDITREIFELYFRLIDGKPNTKGGQYRINLLPTTCHVYFGSVMQATPDGRLATKPLSEGISPFQGADRNGPTAVIKSASKIDHLRTGGTLLNQKLTPSLMEDDQGIEKVLHLVRAYFKMDGHHIQFNVVDAATLKKAQENPDEYHDLIVRVAGYSDYFVNLGPDLQNEIIERTEQKGL